MGDDAEKAIAGLLAGHKPMHLKAAQGPNGLVWECCNEIVGPYELEGEELETAYRAHLASIIAAHMAAPDELTALRAENADLKTRLDIAGMHLTAKESDWTVDICNHIDLADALAERDALRQGLRSLLGYLEKYTLAEEDDRKAAFTPEQAAYWEGRRDSTKEASGQLRAVLGDS